MFRLPLHPTSTPLLLPAARAVACSAASNPVPQHLSSLLTAAGVIVNSHTCEPASAKALFASPSFPSSEGSAGAGQQWLPSADAITRVLQSWCSVRCCDGSSIMGMTLCMTGQQEGSRQPALLMACTKSTPAPHPVVAAAAACT